MENKEVIRVLEEGYNSLTALLNFIDGTQEVFAKEGYDLPCNGKANAILAKAHIANAIELMKGK